MEDLNLRPVTKEDAELLWEWASDPSVRMNSFQQDPIPWIHHVAWLSSKLRSTTCRIWLLEQDGISVGQVRYDKTGKYAEIDFSVAAAFRGHGLGRKLLEISAPRACQELKLKKIVGIVKERNRPSIKIFEHCGFSRKGVFIRDGEMCLRFERACRGRCR